jgi:hypothetical protein
MKIKKMEQFKEGGNMNSIDFISVSLMVILIGIIISIVVKIYKQNELVKNSSIYSNKNFKYRRNRIRARA